MASEAGGTGEMMPSSGPLAPSGDEATPVMEVGSLKELQPLKWTILKTATSFTPRVGHALVSCPVSQKIFMLGGGNHDGDIGEIWSWDYGSPSKSDDITWEPIECKDFTGRYEFAAVVDPKEERIWIFGGADFEKPRNDVCYLDLETKDLITTFAFNREIATQTLETDDAKDFGVPFPRTQGGNSCYIPIGEKIYMAVYGGGVKGEQAVPDGHLYLFDIGSSEWQRIVVSGDTPGLRQGHVMTCVGSKIFLHGGMHEFKIFDDLYSIDLSNFQENPPSWFRIQTEVCPKGRAAHGVAKCGLDLYVFGGLGDEGTLGDLWKFNTEALEWSKIKTSPFPTPRLDAAMTILDLDGATDETGNGKKIVLVHGGMNTEGTLFKDFVVVDVK